MTFYRYFASVIQSNPVTNFCVSRAAVITGEFANAHLLVHMKTAKLGPLWLRVTLSTIIGLGVDTLIFSAVAFFGTVPLNALWSIILVSWALKAGYVLVATPITLVLIAHLNRLEGIDGR